MALPFNSVPARHDGLVLRNVTPTTRHHCSPCSSHLFAVIVQMVSHIGGKKGQNGARNVCICFTMLWCIFESWSLDLKLFVLSVNTVKKYNFLFILRINHFHFRSIIKVERTNVVQRHSASYRVQIIVSINECYRAGSCSGNTLSFYSGGTRFESRPGHLLSWLRFSVVSLNPSTEIPGWYLDYTTTATFRVRFNTSFMNSHTFRCYTV
jgi:hypothetical protein